MFVVDRFSSIALASPFQRVKDIMNKLINYSIIALLGSTSIALSAPSSDAIEAKEKAAWQAFKSKKADDFQKLVSAADFVAVYADGMMNMQSELDTMKKTEMRSFDLSDIKVVMPDANTAVITYKCKVDATTDGKDNSGTSNCASVWHMKNGEWKAIFHTDIKAESKP